MSKYTPGPWKSYLNCDLSFFSHGVFSDNAEHNKRYGDKKGALVVSLTSGQTNEANAHLISAAPEMFELLEDLDAIMGTALHNGHHDLIQRTKDILLKARGGK